MRIPALRERLDSGAELHTFTDAEALEALDHIVRSKPRIVALDHEFSSSSRGTALINRIKDDPSLAACEVARDGARQRAQSRRRAPAARRRVTDVGVAVDEPRPALDQRGTRRAARRGCARASRCSSTATPRRSSTSRPSARRC